PGQLRLVLRVRADGHAGVAVPGDPAPAGVHEELTGARRFTTGSNARARIVTRSRAFGSRGVGEDGAVAVTGEPGPGPHESDMLRRLRARPASSWRHRDRERVARAAVQRLADLSADAASEPRRTVPDAGVTA